MQYANTAIGAFRKKIHGHPSDSVRIPPTTGPIAAPSAPMPVNSPSIFVSVFAGVASPSTAVDRG